MISPLNIDDWRWLKISPYLQLEKSAAEKSTDIRHNTAQDSPPDEVDDSDNKGPILDSGQVGQVICGVADETEKGSEKQGVERYTRRQSRADGKDQQADDKQKVEEHGRDPVHLGTHQVPKMAAVETLGHHAQPDHVYHKKNRQGDEVKNDHLLECHYSSLNVAKLIILRHQ